MNSSQRMLFTVRPDKDIETVDGYLTADSWYRPKFILKDGKHDGFWTETDLRPLDGLRVR